MVSDSTTVHYAYLRWLSSSICSLTEPLGFLSIYLYKWHSHIQSLNGFHYQYHAESFPNLDPTGPLLSNLFCAHHKSELTFQFFPLLYTLHFLSNIFSQNYLIKSFIDKMGHMHSVMRYNTEGSLSYILQNYSTISQPGYWHSIQPTGLI